MTEKELQLIYTAIMKKDVKKAQELVDSMYLGRDQVLLYLKQFVKTKSLQEQEEYKIKYDFFLASYFYYFQIAMPLIEELEVTGNVNFDSYTSFVEIKEALKKLQKKFPEYKNQIEQINLIIKKDSAEKECVQKVDRFFDSTYPKKTMYEEEFYLIATSENPIAVLKNYNWSEKIFFQKLENFKKKYPDKEFMDLIQKLENWFEQYMSEYKRETLTLDFEYRKDQLSIATAVIEDLIASNKSIYEYCHTELNYTYTDIKNYIIVYFGEYKGLMPKTKEFLKLIESRENPKFINNLNYIANKIIDDENYTIIDYYLSTKLDINDFLKKVEIRHPKISEFASKNFDNAYTFGKQSWQRKPKEFNKQQEIKVTRIIKEKLITKEEKEAIFKYLEENQIPINTYTYRAALNKLVNNDLEFNQKINIYKHEEE